VGFEQVTTHLGFCLFIQADDMFRPLL